MAITRSQLVRSAAIVKKGSAVFFTRNDIALKHAAQWQDVITSMFGKVDKFKKDLVIKFPMTLWGAWENVSILFPSAVLNPTQGASLYGSSDTQWIVWARNGTRVTYTNAQITKLTNLYCGVDSDLFAADVEVTAIIGNNKNPEDASAYLVIDNTSFTDTSFAKTNFQKVRFTGAWGRDHGIHNDHPAERFQRGVDA